MNAMSTSALILGTALGNFLGMGALLVVSNMIDTYKENKRKKISKK